MKFAFYAVAVAMIAVALALLLVPLVRHGRRAGRPRGVFILALVVAFVVPLATAGLYKLIGTPATIAGVPKPVDPMQGIAQAITELKARLAAQPNDVEGWLLLGQTYGMLKQPDDARIAYDSALKVDANNGVAMVGWAEADSLARPDHRIEGRGRELLQKAVAADPAEPARPVAARHQRLPAGTVRRRGRHLAQAAADARPGFHGRRRGRRADRTSRRQGRRHTGSDSRRPVAEGRGQPRSRTESQVADGDTLFVFARAENGPPMPLAVARLQASALPASVTLTDGMGMTPQFKLSSVPRVFVAARISKSGQAIAQAGDLEGDAGVLDVATKAPIHITIDRTH